MLFLTALLPISNVLNSCIYLDSKSNIKVRLLLRELLMTNHPMKTILESKEFRNLRFFSEEEIAK